MFSLVCRSLKKPKRKRRNNKGFVILAFSNWILATLMVSFFWVGGRVQAQQNLIARLRKEAPAKWNEYKEKTSHFQGTWQVKRTRNGALDFDYEAAWKKNTSSAFFSLRSKIATRRGYTACYNPKYAFDLEEPKPGSSWVVRGLYSSKEDKFAERLRGEMETGAGFLATLIGLDGAGTLPGLFSYPTFRILEAQTTSGEGKQLVRVTFKNDHEVKATPFSSIQSGVVLLDPNNYWVLCEAELKTLHYLDYVGTVKKTYQWRLDEQGVPVPEKIVTDQRGSSVLEKVTFHIAYVHGFDLGTPDVLLPDSAFTLTAFGLPEPVTETPPAPRYTWLWLVLGAVGLSVCAILLNKYRRQHSA